MRTRLNDLFINGTYFDKAYASVNGTYRNQQPIIVVTHSNGRTISEITEDLSYYGLSPQKGNVFIRNYEGYYGLHTILMSRGIVGPEIATVKFGNMHHTVIECEPLIKAG